MGSDSWPILAVRTIQEIWRKKPLDFLLKVYQESWVMYTKTIIMPEKKDKPQNNIQIKNLPDSEIEIEGEISAEEFVAYRPQAIKNLGKDIEMPGFRKGNVPEKVAGNFHAQEIYES